MADKKTQVWSFSFRALPDSVPEAIRYRRLLKFALRTLGLKCTGYQEPQRPVDPRGLGDGRTK